MTGQPVTPLSPEQHQEQPCIVGLERGRRCLPVVPGSVYCANHHPDREAQRREHTRRAAKASHALFRPDPELEAWADTIDFSTKESRERCLAEAAQLIAKGGLSAAQGNAIAALARAASMKPTEKATAQPALTVEVQRFGPNGQGAAG